MTIGKELQKQRRAKQLSLEAVSQTLRVDQATLQKIEADDFQGLNPVMVRSCIRQYASLLGLDGAQLLDQFTEPAAAGKDIPAAKPASPVKEKVTEVRAANPAPVKEASPAGKAKEILDKSKVPHGFKAIFKFFDAINLDKLLKIGIWVILGLAVVGSVAGGFNALASKSFADSLKLTNIFFFRSILNIIGFSLMPQDIVGNESLLLQLGNSLGQFIIQIASLSPGCYFYTSYTDGN